MVRSKSLSLGIARLVSRLRYAPRRGEWFSRLFVRLVAVVSLVPFVMLWFEPKLLPYAAMSLLLFTAVSLWWAWAGSEYIRPWLASGILLAVYWGSSLTFWLFLENVIYRAVFLAVIVALAWWYLVDWHRVRQRLMVGEAWISATPALALGFVSAFWLATSAVSLVTYLNTSLGYLYLTCYLPLVATCWAVFQAQGWSWRTLWRYWLTAAVILAELFRLVTWWPTSFYVSGFTIAAVYLALMLGFRYDVSGGLDRRGLARELGLVLGALLIVIIFARWF